MGLFKSGRDLNRLADECAALAGVPTPEIMHATTAIAKTSKGGSGRVTSGEVLAAMAATLRLLDQHGNRQTARMEFGDRFDDGRLITHDGKPLNRVMTVEFAANLFIGTTRAYRSHLQ